MCYNPLSVNGISFDELVSECVAFHNDQAFHQMDFEQQWHHMPHTDSHIMPRDIYKAACNLVHKHQRITKPIIKKLKIYKNKVNYHNINQIVPKVYQLLKQLHYYGLAESKYISFKHLNMFKTNQKAYLENLRALIDLMIIDIK